MSLTDQHVLRGDTPCVFCWELEGFGFSFDLRVSKSFSRVNPSTIAKIELQLQRASRGGTSMSRFTRKQMMAANQFCYRVELYTAMKDPATSMCILPGQRRGRQHEPPAEGPAQLPLIVNSFKSSGTVRRNTESLLTDNRWGPRR